MERKTHYGTVTEALAEFKKQGFTVDFNIDGDHLIFDSGKVHADDFEIVDVFRYEGNTDPADEASVYAIQSNTGIKGVLVTSYGAYAETVSSKILRKLH